MAKELPIIELGEGVTVIVITGGPCAGKTTGLARLNELLTNRGYKTLISPESATKLIGAGMTPGELPWSVFQKEILLDTLLQETVIFAIAKKYRDMGRKVVVLCDRGAMDGEAYAGVEKFSKIIADLGITRQELCEGRYHAVIHMRTAAIGAEKFYTLENNAARRESLSEARDLDENTLKAWMSHPHPRVVDNSTGFDTKINRLLGEVCELLGDPVPLEKEDKFLLESFNTADIPDGIEWTQSTIIQNYLISPYSSEERRLRERLSIDGNSATYYYTIKRDKGPGVREEVERIITRREYDSLMTMSDRMKYTIQKRRVCFFWNEQFFEIDTFVAPCDDLVVMEAERTDRTPKLQLPPFIKVVRNVTGEKMYSNATIASSRAES